MAASDFSAPYPFIAMSTGPGHQGADVSGPWPPGAPSVRQRQRWEHDLGALHRQPSSPYLPPPPPHMNSYSQPSYQQSPYTPYTGHGWPVMQPYPSSPFSLSSHQPRPPPAIRSSHADVHMTSSAHGYPAFSTPPQAVASAGNTPSISYREGQPVQATNTTETIPRPPPQTLPLHTGSSGSDHSQVPNQRQRRHPDRTPSHRRSEHTESRTPRNVAAQARRPDRSSSPHIATRRSFHRYSSDLPMSSTSSDVEEAAARSPPSDRVRHQSRESRLRFFRQVYDPNVTTENQISALKANLPKLLLGDLPEDASTTCDICAKDYSAVHVQPSEEEEVALTLPCGHNFGEFCISQWFETCKTHKNKVTCPMCRKQLVETPRSPYMTDRFDSSMFNPNMYMHAARTQSFRDLLSNELQAQYARV